MRKHTSERARLVAHSGSLNGGQLLFIDIGGHAGSEAKVSCQFGNGTAVPAALSPESGHYVCVVPPHPRPERVPVTIWVNGESNSASYDYTTPGIRGTPVFEIRTRELQKRIESVRKRLPDDVWLGAVLKNGEPVSWLGEALALTETVDYFCVPIVQDGIALRNAGITQPILVMYLSEVSDVPLLLHYDLEPAAYSLAWVSAAHQQLERLQKTLRVHLWIDTGMGREGVMPDEALPLAKAIDESPHLELQGIATHFCCLADGDQEALEAGDLENETALQAFRFDQVVESIREAGIGRDAILHAASSGAIRNRLDAIYYDMVRVGDLLFENREVQRRNYSWRTHIQQIKTLPEGWCIDYGCEETTSEDTRVGLVSHIPDDEARFFVRGVEVDYLLHHDTVVVLDLSELPSDVDVGEEVTIILSGDNSVLETYLDMPIILIDE